jgi:hypothetical protein
MLEKFAAQSLVEYNDELIFSKEKFAELIAKDIFATLKQAMLEGDDSKTDEIIDDRLQDAAGDVVDAYGIEDRIY